VDQRDYLRIIQVGNTYELIQAVRYWIDFPIRIKHLDAKIEARQATKIVERPKKDPSFWFGPKWFTKLNQFPAVSVEVRESRAELRRTCYGFREKTTGERVYLRIEPGGIAEFRDSPCGILLGTKYLIPNIDKMYGEKRWDKVSRLLTRLLTKKGIIVDDRMVRKYQRSQKRRVKLCSRLLEVRIKYLPYRDMQRRQREKAKQQI